MLTTPHVQINQKENNHKESEEFEKKRKTYKAAFAHCTHRSQFIMHKAKIYVPCHWQ